MIRPHRTTSLHANELLQLYHLTGWRIDGNHPDPRGEEWERLRIKYPGEDGRDYKTHPIFLREHQNL